jgi:hypothetical protein
MFKAYRSPPRKNSNCAGATADDGSVGACVGAGTAVGVAGTAVGTADGTIVAAIVGACVGTLDGSGRLVGGGVLVGSRVLAGTCVGAVSGGKVAVGAAVICVGLGAVGRTGLTVAFALPHALATSATTTRTEWRHLMTDLVVSVDTMTPHGRRSLPAL